MDEITTKCMMTKWRIREVKTVPLKQKQRIGDTPIFSVRQLPETAEILHLPLQFFLWSF